MRVTPWQRSCSSSRGCIGVHDTGAHRICSGNHASAAMVFHNFREPFSVIALPFKVARPLFCNNNSCMGRGPQRQRLQRQTLQ